VGAVVKQMQEARSLDLCFLVDVTASMGPHILAVKDSIRTIVDTLLKEEADEGREVRSSITSLRSTKSSIVKKVKIK
jgi:uncharacterized protein YegL